MKKIFTLTPKGTIRTAMAVMLTAAAVTLTACQETMDERCAREARDYTQKKCPALVTEGVTIDSLVYHPATHTLAYYYTLEGVIDNAEALKKHDLNGMLLKELRNSTNMKAYKEAGYSFSYTYYSSKEKGKVLFHTVFKEKDYTGR